MTATNGSKGRRVVITGLGVVSAIGIGKEAYWESLRSARSGIKKITSFDVSSYPCQIGGEISGFDPVDFMPSQLARRIDRFAQFGLAASTLAIKDARLEINEENSRDISIMLGTSIGTLCYAERQIALFYEKGLKRINPFFATSVIPSSATTQIMLNLKIKGPCQTITTACASATWSIGEAFHSIKNGKSDIILAGGSEAPLTPLVLSTLGSIELLSAENGSPQTSYRPFSKEAAGFALGEGSGILVLEELEHALKRHADVYAEVIGFGSSADAYHVMLFEPALDQPVLAIRSAMEEAHIEPEEIGYINPHGIAVLENDRCETAIFKKALGDAAYAVPISATKPLTGHSLGAGGAMELIACCLMMQRGYLHPTINFQEPDPLCDLNYLPNEGRCQKVDTMLSVSFGFGGYNAACIIRKCTAA
ncbi:MAG: beta-ketoacyl-[acyl-carrier-protein] synthase family protein [Candidatus Binatia bacterium]